MEVTFLCNLIPRWLDFRDKQIQLPPAGEAINRDERSGRLAQLCATVYTSSQFIWKQKLDSFGETRNSPSINKLVTSESSGLPLSMRISASQTNHIRSTHSLMRAASSPFKLASNWILESGVIRIDSKNSVETRHAMTM